MKHLSDNNYNQNELTNVPDAVDAQDAVNKGQLDTKVTGVGTSKITSSETAPSSPQDGDLWVDQSGSDYPTAEYLAKASNLSDLPSASSARSNLGLGNVDNTSDASKPISTATQSALNAKQDTLVSGTNIRTLNGTPILGSGDLVFPDTTYTEISEAEIDAGTSAALRLITGRRAQYMLDKTVETTRKANITFQSGFKAGSAGLVITQNGKSVSIFGRVEPVSGSIGSGDNYIGDIPAGFDPPPTQVMTASFGNGTNIARIWAAAGGGIYVGPAANVSYVAIALSYVAE